MITSVAGDTLFCNGAQSTPVSVSPGNLGGATCSEGAECTARQATAQALLTFSSGISLVTADDQITSNAYTYAQTLTAATQSVTPLKTVFPTGSVRCAVAADCADYPGARGAGCAAADILCGCWKLRYACGAVELAGEPACDFEPGAECVLPGDAGDGC